MQRPYYYHLALELYPQPSPHSEVSTKDIFVPSPDTDIFASSLPTHHISSWTESASKEKRHTRSNTISTADLGLLRGQRPALGRNASISSGDFHRRPVPDKHLDRVGTPVQSFEGQKDWRFGKIFIQSIDMEERDHNRGAEQEDKAVGRDAQPARQVGNTAVRGKFEPSGPKNTDVGWGVVRLYRDAKESPHLYDDSSSTSDSAPGPDLAQTSQFDENACSTLCILAVPSYMTPSDLLGFVGEQTREDVSHFRLLRTERANKYMVLMKFREPKKAKQWLKEWNGKPFNSMEPENCHVVFVKSISFPSTSADEPRGPSSFPSMTDDPFTPATYPEPTAPTLATSKPLAPPTSSLVELPTCPVCLERMDESTGLLTILCQHVFHCACLEKWRGSGCPVCRYTQGLASLHDDGQENACSVCGSQANLWICLICGNVGCGRYDSAHAFAHYEATSHSYAMDIATQHVWDYAGDGYVHRLISTKADGKGGGSESAGGAGMTAYDNEAVPREKLDNMGMEYAQLLTSQLDNQRVYFEEQLDRAVDKASIATAAAEKASRAAEELAEQVEVLQNSYATSQARISALEKDVSRAEKRADRAEQLARKMTKDWQEEKTLSQGLSKKITSMEAKVKDAEGKAAALRLEKADLEEQNRDLGFFISGQAKLKELEEGGEELEGANVEVGQKKRKGKGRK